MIRINRQTDYAIRVVLALAKRPPGTRISTSDIQREMLIPRALLQRIVAELANHGVINTQTGRDGGVTLAHLPREITLLQIVEMFEGPIHLSDCLVDRSACPFSVRCPVNHRWERLRNLIREDLSQTTFDELAQESIALDKGLSGALLEVTEAVTK